MKFNRNNYEVHALDYLEDTMSASDKQSFEAFLLLNPEIQAEFENLDLVILTPEPTMVYENKDELYQSSPKPIKWWGIILALIFITTAGLLVSKRANQKIAIQAQEELRTSPEKISEGRIFEKDDEDEEIAEPSTYSQTNAQSVASSPSSPKHAIPAFEQSDLQIDIESVSEEKQALPSSDAKLNVDEKVPEAKMHFRELQKSLRQERLSKEEEPSPIGKSTQNLEPIPLRGSLYIEYKPHRPVEVIHPSLIDQYRSEMRNSGGKLERWLTGIVPNAYRKGGSSSIKEKLLPEYMVAE